jgi:hypothetical protein
MGLLMPAERPTGETQFALNRGNKESVSHRARTLCRAETQEQRKNLEANLV